MATASVQIQRFHRNRSAMFDLGLTAELARLFETGRDARDSAWLDRFYDVAWFAAVEAAGVYPGPDGLPYLRLDLPKDGRAFDSHCLANRAGDCLAAGWGAALFASADDPPEAAQFVFSLGVLDSLIRYDSPDGDPVDVIESALAPAPQPRKRGWFGLGAKETPRQVLLATPSDQSLPPYAAKALHKHLTQVWDLRNPRVQLMTDMSLRPHRHLMIGKRRSEFPDEQSAWIAMQHVLWHLPPMRSAVLLPENWRLEELTPLRDLFAGAPGL
ncbi:MAG: hypothetical protein ACK4SZ_12035 [Allosphingosinicella sp.]|uniref:hypothetical protein n=1 Tax=Allosphingosinicella sp. TaxID=2823234 RepID=UPI0039506B2E